MTKRTKDQPAKQMPRQDIYAISMGDLVASSAYSDPNELHMLFNQIVDQANRRFADSIASPLTITLGDEYQGLSTSLGRAFELNNFVRMSLLLKGVSTRLVLGAGVIDTPINATSAWNMMGKGLSEARDKLNEKKHSNCYRFSFPEHVQLALALDGVGIALTKIESDWTRTQMEYVAKTRAEPEKSRSQIADDIGISKNSFYKVLRTAHLKIYEELLKTVRKVLDMEDENRETRCKPI